MSDAGQDLEMNTIPPQEPNDLEQDVPVPSGPRRQEWEFKRRHVEAMLLGLSRLSDD
jgi:hypothetical protein